MVIEERVDKAASPFLKIIVFIAYSNGGIADYAHDQAEALHDSGHEVIVLAPPEFHQRDGRYHKNEGLVETRAGNIDGSRLMRRLRLIGTLTKNYKILRKLISSERPDHILTHFEEYLSPLWAPNLKRTAQKYGVGLHSVLHDPDRHYVVGPKWWHELSVRTAFNLYDDLYVHHQKNTGGSQGQSQSSYHINWSYIPYGIHAYPNATQGPDAVRAHYGISQNNTLMAAFGFIRDNKNIDLVIRAMAKCPTAELVVAGAEMGGGQKPVSFYKALAQELGVADRCHFDIRFFSSEESANLLNAADFGILTYARSFVSSSAAFSLYAHYELPALVSSGSSEMELITKDYNLGQWVTPDELEPMIEAMASLIATPPLPRWGDYKADHSWTRNAKIITSKMRSLETS